MEGQIELADEAGRLRAGLNDLVSVMALWPDREPLQIVKPLADALLGTLRVAFVFVRLNDPEGGPPIEIARVDESFERTAHARDITSAVYAALAEAPPEWTPRRRLSIGAVDLSLASVGLGPDSSLGTVIVGSRNLDFPAQTETLLLDVATNQAAIGLQHARLLSDQKRRAAEVDRRIVLRPSELAATNVRLETEVAERRHDEEALRDKEREARLIIDSMPAGAAIMTSDGEVEFVNDPITKYFGKTLEDLKRWGTNDAVHPDDLPHVIAAFTHSLATGDPYNTEERLRRFDGTYRWFQVRGLPLRDAGGRVVRWCVLHTDIDDRKRAEEALRESERESRLIVDSIPGLVAILTPSGDLAAVNDRVVEYCGRSKEELKEWSTNDTLHPEDRSRSVALFAGLITSGLPSDWEARVRRFDGVYRWFQFRALPLRDSAGRLVRWYALLTDIEDLKRTDALLAGEKRLLEMIALGHPLPTFLDALCRLVEELVGGCHCSVLLIDPTGATFRGGAAPSLPRGYSAALDGLPVEPETGPCAFAGSLKTQVIVSNIPLDARWRGANGWNALASAYGLKSCWSTPILSLAGTTLGTFAIYGDAPGDPTAHQQDVIAQITHLASIAIERAQDEAALRRSETFLAQAQRLTLTGSLWWNVSTGELTWSDESYRIFGYPKTTAPTVARILERVHPEDLSLAQETVDRSAREGGNIDFEHRLLMPDGSIKWVHVVVQNVSAEDGPAEFVGAVTDITERKRAEAELRRAYDHLTEAQRLSQTGSFTADLERDEHFWSEEFYRICEFEPGSQVTIQKLGEIVHPEDIALYEGAIGRAMAGTDPDFYFRIVTSHGVIKHLRGFAHRIADRPVFVGAVQDVTASKMAQEALNKAGAELAHVSRVTALSALTASIAHEVNQPLSGIMTNAGTCLRMLDASPPNVEGARETARRTIRDGNRASEVVTRLRALFTKKEFTLEPLDLNEATREVIALAANDLQRNRIILHSELCDDLPPVAGDRIQLQQVVLNLLRNASDAMVDVHHRPRQLLVKTERDDDDRVRLTVRDTGMGLPPQSQGSLFDAFYTTKSGGMGIGLFVSRSIIERHRGRLWAEPNDGGLGATFAFAIPHASTTM
jgi:PAS domain S-box-containing protein